MKPENPCKCAQDIKIEKCSGKFALAPKDCNCAFGRCLRDDPDKCPAYNQHHDGYAAGFSEAIELAAQLAFNELEDAQQPDRHQVAVKISAAIRAIRNQPK